MNSCHEDSVRDRKFDVCNSSEEWPQRWSAQIVVEVEVEVEVVLAHRGAMQSRDRTARERCDIGYSEAPRPPL
eukprot:gene10968-biopygen3080